MENGQMLALPYYPSNSKEYQKLWYLSHKTHLTEYRLNNKTRRNLQTKKWFKDHPDYHKQYNLINKERRNAQSREAYAKDPEKRINSTKKWKKNNPQQYEISQKISNNKKTISGYFRNRSPLLWQKTKINALLKIDPLLKCKRCGCDDIRFLEVNHINGGGKKEHERVGHKNIHALILSGRRDVSDLEILCKPCNHIHYLELKYNEKIPLRVVFSGKEKEGEQT